MPFLSACSLAATLSSRTHVPEARPPPFKIKRTKKRGSFDGRLSNGGTFWVRHCTSGVFPTALAAFTHFSFTTSFQYGTNGHCACSAAYMPLSLATSHRLPSSHTIKCLTTESRPKSITHKNGKKEKKKKSLLLSVRVDRKDTRINLRWHLRLLSPADSTLSYWLSWN